MDRDYLLRCLEAFELVLAALGFGTTFVAVNKNHLTSFVIPLPPLAEQHRIVAKVDELMTLCDRLEAARMEREATRDRMATASLAHLDTPDPDPATFQKPRRLCPQQPHPAHHPPRPDQGPPPNHPQPRHPRQARPTRPKRRTGIGIVEADCYGERAAGKGRGDQKRGNFRAYLRR